jgi:hypothetical protein
MIGASALGAGASLFGQSQAISAQQQATQQANALVMQQQQQNQQNLAPWMTNGTNANNLVSYLTGTSSTAPSGYNGNAGGQGALTTPFAPTIAQLQQTPGYQFIMDQGLKSTQNSYASKGLASSGAAMKGAADYASGLAGSTYQQQFQNYWNQNQNIYNMLTGQASQGLTAATSLTGQNSSLTNTLSGNTTGLGNAQAGAYNAMGNTVNSALTNAAGQYYGYNILGNLLNSKTNGTSSNPYYGPLNYNAPGSS